MDDIERDGVVLHVFGKLENLQSVYTFKARGAEWFVNNLIMQYHEKSGRFKHKREKPSLVTASAGNHAQGVALAAKRYGLEAIIFMPHGTPEVKLKRVGELGATIRMEGDVFDESLAVARAYKKESESRVFVPPYENPHIMAGQASVAVEILSKTCPYHPDYLRVADMGWKAPDVIIAGLGGGGLVSGMGSVVKEFNEMTGNNVKVIGVQAEAADSMYKSVKAGECVPSTDMHAKTCADGINVKQASPRMVETVRRYVYQVVTVSERDIIQGIVDIAEHGLLMDERWHTNEWLVPDLPYRSLPEEATHVHEHRRMNRVEGAGAAPYAAVFFGDSRGDIDWRAIAGHKKELDVYCVFTGGNIPNDKWTALRNEFGTEPSDGKTKRKG